MPIHQTVPATRVVAYEGVLQFQVPVEQRHLEYLERLLRYSQNSVSHLQEYLRGVPKEYMMRFIGKFLKYASVAALLSGAAFRPLWEMVGLVTNEVMLAFQRHFLPSVIAFVGGIMMYTHSLQKVIQDLQQGNVPGYGKSLGEVVKDQIYLLPETIEQSVTVMVEGLPQAIAWATAQFFDLLGLAYEIAYNSWLELSTNIPGAWNMYAGLMLPQNATGMAEAAGGAALAQVAGRLSLKGHAWLVGRALKGMGLYRPPEKPPGWFARGIAYIRNLFAEKLSAAMELQRTEAFRSLLAASEGQDFVSTMTRMERLLALYGNYRGALGDTRDALMRGIRTLDARMSMWVKVLGDRIAGAIADGIGKVADLFGKYIPDLFLKFLMAPARFGAWARDMAEKVAIRIAGKTVLERVAEEEGGKVLLRETLSEALGTYGFELANILFFAQSVSDVWSQTTTPPLTEGVSLSVEAGIDTGLAVGGGAAIFLGAVGSVEPGGGTALGAGAGIQIGVVAGVTATVATLTGFYGKYVHLGPNGPYFDTAAYQHDQTTHLIQRYDNLIAKQFLANVGPMADATNAPFLGQFNIPPSKVKMTTTIHHDTPVIHIHG